mgnify:CR=1 FL=1
MDKTWKRKIDEAILAFELETHYTKDEILRLNPKNVFELLLGNIFCDNQKRIFASELYVTSWNYKAVVSCN